MLNATNAGRRLVPRWRNLSATLESKELGVPTKGASNENALGTSGDFLGRLERWRISPDLISAAELVEAAIVEGREHEAVPAARRLLTVDETAAPLIRQQAAALLVRTGHSEELPHNSLIRPSHAQEPRYYTRLHPRDPLAWVELSLHQTIGGHSVAADRSMTVALSLAPHNRHVLRSAARLFLHQNDPEHAHDLLAGNEATRHDPWLIASEIALAEVAKRRSRFAKTGQRLLDAAGFPVRQITELAGAIGTEELLSGNRRRARKTFALSMRDPTGNSLAQGEWAAADLGHDLVPVARLKSAPEPSEALAFHLHRLGHFKYVASVCTQWASADPFSIRPYEFGAATAGFIEQYDTAAALALKGLQLRPNAPSLMNAGAFALASGGRLAEAEAMLDRMGMVDDQWWRHFASANRGLLAYRAGDEPRAIAYYRQAIEGFEKAGHSELSAKARVYLAREAVIAHSDFAPEFLVQAKTAMAPHKHARESLLTLEHVEKLFNRKEAKDLSQSDLHPKVNQTITSST
jgi:tetratricopeptide (TPR) repeat protein